MKSLYLTPVLNKIILHAAEDTWSKTAKITVTLNNNITTTGNTLSLNEIKKIRNYFNEIIIKLEKKNKK